MYQSTNPILSKDDKFREFYGAMTGAEKTTVATLQGVVNKTAILVLITIIAGAGAYAFLPVTMGVLVVSSLAAMATCFGVGFMMRGNPKAAPVLAPIFAIVEGVFLGSLTSCLDVLLNQIQSARAVAAGAVGADVVRVSLAMPAFLITISLMLAMLGLYSARIIRPTERFKAVLGTLVLGVMITYALTWVLAMFGMSIPFLRLSSATGGGYAPYIGIGISVLILGIASLCLIVDFGRAEDIVNKKMPRYMEWYAGFGLLVTLAWVYYEAVMLAFRLYLLFGGRD